MRHYFLTLDTIDALCLAYSSVFSPSSSQIFICQSLSNLQPQSIGLCHCRFLSPPFAVYARSPSPESLVHSINPPLTRSPNRSSPIQPSLQTSSGYSRLVNSLQVTVPPQSPHLSAMMLGPGLLLWPHSAFGPSESSL